MSRVSREHAAKNRAKVVAVASSLFRRRGLDGIGIRELMAEAGLTQGGFSGQFGSKDVLAGEACADAFAGAERTLRAAIKGDDAGRLHRLAELYFTSNPPGDTCPMATLAGDAARAPAGGPVRQAFTAGLSRLANAITDDQPDDKALAIMAAMVGAAVLRRASDDTALADAIESAVLRLAAVESKDAAAPDPGSDRMA
jgi:TetR/AcrR family transcriptional regulator, transcriptional repressor for nem operon